MGSKGGNAPFVNDPELEADFIRSLKIVGPLGVLNVLDVVIPVVTIADVGIRRVDTQRPSYLPADTASGALLTAPAAFTTLVDTGALAAGIYDLVFMFSAVEPTVVQHWQIQHRDAANAANVDEWFAAVPNTGYSWSVAYAKELAFDERIRVLNNAAGSAGSKYSVSIFHVRRN